MDDEFLNSDLNIFIERTTKDTYLKVFSDNLYENKIKPKNPDILNSGFDVFLEKENFSFTGGANVYEDLTKIHSDRYQFVLPYYNYSQNSLLTKFGSLGLTSKGDNILDNTNNVKSRIINDLNFTSYYDYTPTIGNSALNFNLDYYTQESDATIEFIAPLDGEYLVSFNYDFETNNGYYNRMYFYVNGETYYRSQNYVNSSVNYWNANYSAYGSMSYNFLSMRTVLNNNAAYSAYDLLGMYNAIFAFTPPVKCFSRTSVVLMSDLSWKWIDEIQEGDSIFTSHGPSNVTNLHITSLFFFL